MVAFGSWATSVATVCRLKAWLAIDVKRLAHARQVVEDPGREGFCDHGPCERGDQEGPVVDARRVIHVPVPDVDDVAIAGVADEDRVPIAQAVTPLDGDLVLVQVVGRARVVERPHQGLVVLVHGERDRLVLRHVEPRQALGALEDHALEAVGAEAEHVHGGDGDLLRLDRVLLLGALQVAGERTAADDQRDMRIILERTPRARPA